MLNEFLVTLKTISYSLLGGIFQQVVNVSECFFFY